MDVKLNVYHLPEQSQTNSYLVSLGLGLFHSGVEINGSEYCFSSAGICRTAPRLPEFGTFKEQLAIGRFAGSMNDLQLVLQRMRTGQYRSGAYDLVHLNCNCFADALCFELTQQHIPDWINRAANIAASVAIKPANAQETSQQNFANLGTVSKNSPIFGVGVPKSVAPPIQQQQQQQQTQQSNQSSVFGWFGGLFGSNSSSISKSTSSSSNPSTKIEKVTLDKEDKSKKREMSAQQKEMLEKLKQQGKSNK